MGLFQNGAPSAGSYNNKSSGFGDCSMFGLFQDPPTYGHYPHMTNDVDSWSARLDTHYIHSPIFLRNCIQSQQAVEQKSISDA